MNNLFTNKIENCLNEKIRCSNVRRIFEKGLLKKQQRKLCKKIMNSIRLISKLQNCSILRTSNVNNIARIVYYSNEPSKIPSKNPKLKTSPKITLVTGKDQIEIISLEQAKKLAERRQMKLVSIVDFDTKTQRAVYK